MNLQDIAAILCLILIFGFVLNTLYNVVCDDDSESSKLIKDVKERMKQFLVI